MRKRMDEKIRKKYSKIYAYNINNQNLRNNKTNGI